LSTSNVIPTLFTKLLLEKFTEDDLAKLDEEKRKKIK